MTFAGYTWSVKASSGPVGPGPNYFSDSSESVRVDGAGLHMRLTYRVGRWHAAEIVLDRSLGYGTYRFTVASLVGRLDPNVVLGLFTWSDDTAYNNREIDIEVARWGNPTAPTNAQYVVQPSTVLGNTFRFVLPDGAGSVHELTWAPKAVSFRSVTAAGAAIADWKYGGKDVPRAKNERARINLWLTGGKPPTDGAEVEVVLSDFSHAAPFVPSETRRRYGSWT